MMWKGRLVCFHTDQMNLAERSVAYWPLSYSIVPANPYLQALAAFRFRPGISFWRRKISTFMSKFEAHENTGKFWVKYFRGGVKISLTPFGFICCGMVKNCKPQTPIPWENSISPMYPRVT